jgi:hypothetical protein
MKYCLPTLLLLICGLTACRSTSQMDDIVPSNTTESRSMSQMDDFVPSNATEKRLNKIIIDVCFRGANLSDCLKVLQGHIDKQASEDNRVAPRFVCDLEMAQFLLDRTDPGPHAHRYPPLARFEAKDISVFEAMIILSELCEVQFASTPKLIIVEQIEEETANQ